MDGKNKPEMIGLVFGPRDDKRLLSWFIKAKDRGTNIGNLIMKAVEHYEETGRYYCLGKINEPEGKSQKKRTSIYVNRNSEFYKILERKKAEESNISRYIKTIIYNGVSYTEGKEYIPSQYENLRELEEITQERKIETVSAEIDKNINSVQMVEDKKIETKTEIKKRNQNSLAMELLKNDVANGFGLSI